MIVLSYIKNKVYDYIINICINSLWVKLNVVLIVILFYNCSYDNN